MMNPRSQDLYTQAYNKWVVDQTPDNMAGLVSAFMPTINSEIQQYSGPKALLRARAKAYVVEAIRSYDPTSNTKLNTWVITNLKQLSRYGKRLRPIRASENTIRNVAEYKRISAELEDSLGRKPTDDELQDHTGWSKKELDKLRAAAVTTLNSNAADAKPDVEAGPEDPAINMMNNVPFARDATYMSLNQRDKDIFDYRLGEHGKPMLSGKEIADKLGVTPAYISQRAANIGSILSDLEAR
jgi:DNA-directed RNA polymerase specialized sigma subunit